MRCNEKNIYQHNWITNFFRAIFELSWLRCYAWLECEWLSANFLGNNKAPGYDDSTNCPVLTKMEKSLLYPLCHIQDRPIDRELSFDRHFSASFTLRSCSRLPFAA